MKIKKYKYKKNIISIDLYADLNTLNKIGFDLLNVFRFDKVILDMVNVNACDDNGILDEFIVLKNNDLGGYVDKTAIVSNTFLNLIGFR